MPSVSVIICAYSEKRWHALAEAIESVQKQELPPAEIILVIDHNPELEKRARLRFPDVIAIENSGKRGLSEARNSGIGAARGDVLAFIDDDAVAAPDWLTKLVACYADPKVLGAGGSIEPLWPEQRPAWFPDEFLWVVGCTYLGMPQTTAPVRNLIGCNMSFKREVFESNGGFRNSIGRVGTLPAGCEETELCIRVRHNQPESELRYEPGARVQHRIPSERLNWHYFRSRCYYEGRSKAIITGLVGTSAGLASERAYTLRTLPRGILRGLADAILRQDKAGLARAAAMIAGLTITTYGYLAEKLRLRTAANSRSAQSSEGASQPDDLMV